MFQQNKFIDEPKILFQEHELLEGVYMVESSPCIVEGLPFVSTIRATLIPPRWANFAFILLHLDGERLNNTFHTYISHLIASGTTVTLG